MNKVFFTGLSGFLGKNFLDYYNSRKSVDFELIELPKNYNSIQKKYNYSFCSEDFSAGVDILVHAGAFSPKTKEQMDDIAPNLQNIENTKYLLENLPNIPKK